MNELKVTTFRWLVHKDSLSYLEEQCDTLRSDIQRVYRLVLPLDVPELVDYSVELGDAVLHHPREAWGLFQEVVYTVLTVLRWLPCLSGPSQLLLVLRLSELPRLPGYVVRSVCDIPSVTSEARFLSLTGIVVSITVPSKYTQSASFRCLREKCTGNGDFIRLHVAGASEASTMRNDLHCMVCGHKLEEDVKYRILGDKVIINMMLSSSLNTTTPSVPYRHQAVSVVLRDELIRDVLLGGLYTIIGIPVYQLSGASANIDISIEANNITHIPVPVAKTASCKLSATVQEIYDACSYSSWTFAATLAYSFAAHVSPPGTYHQMKLAMLLSLVCSRAVDVFPLDPDLNTSLSLNCCSSQFIDLLVMDEDDAVISRLLNYGSQFAHSSLLYSHQAELTGCFRREDSNYFIDAGSLLLARNGICVVEDVTLHKKDTKEILQRVLESRQITISGGRREPAAGAPLQYTTPLSCTVWTSCTQNYHKGISKTFTDRFALIVDNTDSLLESHDFVDQQMVEDIIGRHTEKHQHNITDIPLSYSDFEQLLVAASKISVSLSSVAQQLIQSFYLASRRARSRDNDIPTSAFTSMCLLAVAHARLNLHTEAMEEDAILAILLYEEALTNRTDQEGKNLFPKCLISGEFPKIQSSEDFPFYGICYSVLNLVPCPHFRDDNTGAYIGQQYDDKLTIFHHQIIDFIKAHQYPGVFMREE